ncbi:glutamyl-tRNA synthetase [Erythrobacter sp. SG61-1L]|uniref:HIG1 domain-containing protein n=1 Tax=Erythrobacter sp. SG61-1L TaxID=1603897 RepID=UPI0006C90D59|nr:HIG1 domain-containing protein [Erythrobacter sp. SG61-1L]KPL68902.1 glutamyl-tRNA synthetase [Erythrobacter sp. SG61-1L]
MNTFLVIVLLGLMAMVVYSLVRGIVAFLQTTRRDIDNGDTTNLRELQLLQNKMMFARIKYQALAIVVIVIILAAGR